ncbi:sensor histidine kinase [Streptomyces nodosus]|uniref:sensor histidine kinase n=1 Tax=Streptomyces nodosus TaxID=40318 RepID=UPI000A882C5E|nr:histidine kinase [Streptomyces nodosus]MBB4789560.1 signal transduction histidine kinase [Streptomyces nodosus]
MTTQSPMWSHPQAERWVGAGRRLRHADRRRPWVLDVCVVLVVLLAIGIPDLISEAAFARKAGLPTTGIIGLQLGLTLPLLWRRKKPSAALAAVLAVFLIQWPLDVLLNTDIAVFVALYSLARHGRLRHLAVGGAWVLAALVQAALRVPDAISPIGALFFLWSTATAAMALGLGLRVNQDYLAALRRSAAQLEIEREQRDRLAVAAERTRIARDMHDIVGHHLSVMIGLADGGAQAIGAAPERSRQALQLISGSGRQALSELRRTLTVLHDEQDQDAAEQPALHPQPGLSDLASLCDRVRAAGPEITLTTTGGLVTLDTGTQLAAYRIVQEALTNMLKHAGKKTQASVTVSRDADALHIRIEDTGPPTASTQSQPSREKEASGAGHGIVGMKERAAVYEGTVTAGPRPGGGWTVHAALRVPPALTSRGRTAETA